MNTTQSKFNFKAFVMLLTALVLSFVLCFATACGDSSSNESSSASESESSSETENVTDTQMIANGNFELHVPESASYPYNTSSNIKWTRTSYGSTKSSGVIDTTKDEYKDASRVGDDEHKKVLMLANSVNSDGEGAAQYFTSSTTVSAEYGTDYLLTVWVRTTDISGKYADGNDNVDTGAYIEVKNTVGKSIDSTIIDNIDTKGEWKMYSIYLRPSNITSTKYQVVLGLGHGNTDNKLRGCDGTAYFDDVKMEKLDAGKFDEATGESLKLYDGDKKTDVSLVVNTAKTDADTAKADFTKGSSDVKVLDGGSGAFNNYNLNNDKDSEGYTVDAPANGALTIDFSKAAREYGSSYTYTTKSFDLAKYVNNDEDDDTEYKGVMISFIANVTAKSYSKNASVKVIDNDKENGGFDSFVTDGKDVRYAIYLTTNRADGENALTYSLKITFGPTSKSSVNTDFPVGTATFKDFSVVTLTEEEFALADTSNNGTTVTLLGDYNSDASKDNDNDSTASDSYDITTGDVMYNADTKEGYEIKLNQIAGGTYKEVATSDNEGNKAILVNSAYTYKTAGLNDALNDLKKDYLNGNPNKNKEVQAIALYSKTGNFIRMTANNLPTTVAANSVYKFSVKLRVVSGKAFVRLYDYNLDDVTASGNVAKFTEDKDYLMQTEIDSTAKKDRNGYTTVTFIVRTGDEAKNFELQFGFEGEGMMLIGSADKGSSYTAANDYDTLVKAFDSKYYAVEEVASHTKTVKYYTNEEDAKNGKNPVTEKKDGKTVDKVTETTDVVVAYGYLKNSDGSNGANVVQFYRYDTKDTVLYVIEADESTSESESASESQTTDSTASYAWLQIVSIVIAAVLIIALVAVIIRMANKNKKNKKSRKNSYYHVGYDASKSKPAAKGSNKNNIVAPDETNEAYDYGDGEENAENDKTDKE